MIYDLHSHSVISDGSLTPEALVERAHAQGVDVLALTDHDDTGGLEQARRKAEELGIKFVNGVEISVSWGNNQTIHIVGLNVDPNSDKLQNGLREIREERIRRAKKISEKLGNCGIPNVWEEIVEQVGFEAVTRTHFARYLMAKGYVKEMQPAFTKWLGKKGKAFVNGKWAAMEDGIDWIVRSGGQAVIAHPVRYNMTRSKLERLTEDFKRAGGEGIEVVANRYSRDEIAQTASIARRHDLLASVGSDFHEPGNPYVELGRNLQLPDDCKPIWHDWKL